MQLTIINYLIAVTPLSDTSQATGIIKTSFIGSIMEARERNQNASATNSWRDCSSVSDGIIQFQKKMLSESGIKT